MKLSEENIKIAVCEEPVNNKANNNVVEFIAKMLKTDKSNVEIIRGLKNRRKKIKIYGKNREEVMKIFGEYFKKDSINANI